MKKAVFSVLLFCTLSVSRIFQSKQVSVKQNSLELPEPQIIVKTRLPTITTMPSTAPPFPTQFIKTAMPTPAQKPDEEGFFTMK
jgi:hypothetical protein